MSLPIFLTQLRETGEVEVDIQMRTFRPRELRDAKELLAFIYQEEKFRIPAHAPIFDEKAASWAAGFLYRACQFLILRELGKEELEKWLKPFDDMITAPSIYSVDLSFRYLPDVLKLAKGLAPDDPLVAILMENASFWPFSSVGMRLEDWQNEAEILQHAALRQAYVDRIIEKKDKSRLQNEQVLTFVKSSLGAYVQTFWPTFNF